MKKFALLLVIGLSLLVGCEQGGKKPADKKDGKTAVEEKKAGDETKKDDKAAPAAPATPAK